MTAAGTEAPPACGVIYIIVKIFISFNIKYHHVGGGDPVHEEDGAVVVDVQEGHVAVLAPQEEEYRVLVENIGSRM